MGGKAIDKALKVDNTLPGFQAKKLVKPFVQLGTGVAGALKLKDPNLKLVAAGVGASVCEYCECGLKKDLLEGIPGIGEIAGLGEPMGVYQDPIHLSIPAYNPDLPMLDVASAPETEWKHSTGPAVAPQSIEADFEII